MGMDREVGTPRRRFALYAVVLLVVLGIGAVLVVAFVVGDDDEAAPPFATLPDGEFDATVALTKPDGSRSDLEGTCLSIATSITIAATDGSDGVRFFLALVKPHETFPPVNPSVAEIDIDGESYLDDASSADVTDRYGRSGTLTVDGLLDPASNLTEGRYVYEWSCEPGDGA